MKFNIENTNTFDTLCEYVDSDNVSEFTFIYNDTEIVYSETELFLLYDFLNAYNEYDYDFHLFYESLSVMIINMYTERKL